VRALALLWVLMAAPALAAERVVDFHSAIRIGADGVLTVTERILVEAEGREIRRGILRDFPTDYRDRFGNRVNVPFEVVEVKRNGSREPWSQERLVNGERIRIGRADVLLSPGVQIYEITYRTARQVGYFADHDELYWNVNGNGWSFAFDHISAEVLLPSPVPAGELRAEAYTGPQGARGRNYQSMIRDGAVGFTSTASFAPREGMSIVVGFPKGIVGEPTLMQRAEWFFTQNRGATAGVAGLVLMFGFLYWRWSEVGRDPKPGVRFPRYEAPKGVSAAAVRYIDRQGYDDRCFAAGLLGLASRGHMKVRQSADCYTLRPTGTAAAPLAGERALLRFAAQARDIGAQYDAEVADVRRAHQDELSRLYEDKAFSLNRGSLVLGALIGAGTLALMVFMQTAIPNVIVIALLMLATLVAFYRWLPAYSPTGRQLEDEIEGLREYLGVAERDDLARQKTPPPAKTAEEFSRFLPYAVALGVEKTWADRFAAALGTAALAQAVSSWYQSGSGSDFSVSHFTDSVSSLDNAISSSATPPGSSSGSSDSGGGGGGGSGGGGGGGGGSGW